jgi:LDH2 family malate/lactate/ureidoglycolate dehydrogenase
VLIPGDPEREMEAIRKKEGINLHESVVTDLKAIAEELGLQF